jgi:hypothetical protein
VGFLVFLRYCLEISYFPELSLADFAGFCAAIFVLSLLVVTVFLSLWWGSSMPMKAILLQWEGYKNQGRRFVQNIYIWTIASLILPSLILFIVFGTNPQGYKGNTQMPYVILVCAVLMGICLPFFARRFGFIKPDWIKSLPCNLRIGLHVYGGLWGFFGLFVVILAYFGWGWIGMALALYGEVLLLTFGMGAMIPADQDKTKAIVKTDEQITAVPRTFILGGTISLVGLCFIIAFPNVPTLIVQALGIGAYDDADLVVEKRYSEALGAEGISFFGDPSKTFSYIEVLNDDTIMLRHMRILLRVGSQIALRKRSERKQGLVSKSIILLPATQVLQLSHTLYIPG